MNLSDKKKILLIRLSSLGDVLLTTPMVRSIKNQYPKIELHYIVREEYKDALLLNPNIDKLILFANNKSDDMKELIRKENYDLVIDLQHNWRSSGLLEKTKSGRVKFNKKNFSKFLLVYFKINLLRNVPPVPVRYIEGLKDIHLDDKGADLFTNKTHSEKLVEGIKYIGLAPGAKHFTKRWLPEYFVETGNSLSALGYCIVLFGGKDDKDFCKYITEGIPGAVNLQNNNDLLQTAADMKLCMAVLGNDSGLLHTAAASGVPVAVLFGSTVKEFGFTPYKSKSRVIEHLSLPCRPCTHIGRSSCPKGHFKCMKEITPDSVLDNLISLIS